MDMTFTFGNLLTIATIVGGLFIAYGKIKERLVAIETQLGPVWADYNARLQRARFDGDRE